MVSGKQLDQSFNGSVRQWVRSKSPNIAMPDKEVAQARAKHFIEGRRFTHKDSTVAS